MGAFPRPTRILPWNKLGEHDQQAIHIAGNAHKAKFAILKGIRKGYGLFCYKCKPSKTSKNNKKDKPKQLGALPDPTLIDNIVYEPLYIGCDRAISTIPPETGDFLRYAHGENIQYTINNPFYNPSNVDDPTFINITYPTNPKYTSYIGQILVNVCIPNAQRYEQLAISALNKSRELSKEQILGNIYNLNAFSSLYPDVFERTEFEQTFEFISYIISLIASAIRNGMQIAAQDYDAVSYFNVYSYAEKLINEVSPDTIDFSDYTNIIAFIDYIKSRTFALYTSVNTFVKHVAVEEALINTNGNLTSSTAASKTEYSPVLIDILDKTVDLYQTYLDKYYIPDPTKPQEDKDDDKNIPIPSRSDEDRTQMAFRLDNKIF